MSYIRKIIAKDEELIGIARLHWIYVVKGLTWFIGFAGIGWLLHSLITRGLMYVGGATNSYAFPAALMSVSNAMMLFMMAGGFLIFFLFVLKILVTEVGLSNRRIIEKTGLLFVKVRQIDLEEVRGENMDMGHLGRIFGYAYILLDCRFLGDIRLPAIENPERFLRVLHELRAKTQDALSLVVGKGNAVPVGDVVATSRDGGLSLQVQDPKPEPPKQPDIQPGQVPGPEIAPPGPAGPEIQPEPTPHAPPAPPPAPGPVTPPAQPAQPIPAPPDPRPPLQPPSGAAPLDPATVAQVVQQVTPQITQQVVRQMAEQGLLKEDAPEPANDVDTDLIARFDEARVKEDESGVDHQSKKMEYAIH